MIRLKFCEIDSAIRKQMVHRFYVLNVAIKRNAKKIEQLDQWCKKYLNGYNNSIQDINFMDVVEADPIELEKLKTHLDTLPSYAVEELYTFKNDKIRCYVVDTLYESMYPAAKDYLLKVLDVKVCPYCDRNYVYSAGIFNTCELDHFFPKKKYPILATSFYNLIPVCGYCNGKKLDNEFSFYPHKPKNNGETIRFSYVPKKSDFLSNESSIDIQLDVIDPKIEKQIEILGLRDLYKKHNDIAFDIIRKSVIYSESYMETLYNEFKNMFSDRQELKELIFGYAENPDRFGDKPLHKLAYDIRKDILNE